MRTHPKPLAGVVLWGALAILARTSAAEPNVVRAIEVAERGDEVELAIHGSREPSYTVFKLQDPPRVVVDLSGADVSRVASPVQVGRGGVLAVSTAQYRDARSAVGRIVVALDGERRYEVAARGDALLVRVLGDSATARAPQGPREARPTPEPPAFAAAPATSSAPATLVAAGAEAQGRAAAPAADDRVVSRRVDEVRVASPARAVTRVTTESDRIVVATDGQVGRIEILELRDPPRLAVDLHGVARAPRAPVKGTAGFSQVRFGRSDDKVRIVLDAAGALPAYEVKRLASGVAIVTTPPAERAAAAPPARAAGKAPAAKAPAQETAHPRARISDVRFSQQGGFARIEIAGKARHAVTRPDARTVVLSLEDAELAKKLERSLDTTAFHGPVVLVSSFNQPATGQVKIVATLRGEANDRIEETVSGLAWTFRAAATGGKSAEPAPLVRVSDAQSAGFAAEAPGYALSGAPMARGYTGRRITLDFHDIEIRNLLRLIADVSKKNIVVADDVTGKVTVALRNVPWDQALDLVLKSKGLGKEEMGNIIRIAKYEQIAKEQQARAEAEKARAPTLPLKVRIIPVNFAVAGEMAGRVKDVLSERGSVSTDTRTNVLIVKDVQEALVRAEGLVRNLDTEIPQVLIESRIVEASSNFNRAIGIQWGGSAAFTQATGNPTGLAFPANAVAAGASAGPFAVSLPAPVGEGSGGAIGLMLGSAGSAFNLNLRLSALENSGVVKTISAPKISTIDNKEATIGQGISIPFSQVSASGVNTTFIEAKLELKVTPHVSSDGSILLKIKATNNSPNPQLTGANGQPSISKREAETEVLVKDGETTVIGGIYTRQTSNRRAEVPFFGKIPILGAFFRTTSEIDDHTELLIFITPRILNRAATTVATGATN
jgi:type IV pilus assembly protein PilQ